MKRPIFAFCTLITGVVMIVALFYLLTLERIQDNQDRVLRLALNSLLPSTVYDNDLLRHTLAPFPTLQAENTSILQINLAKKEQQVTAVIFDVLAHGGYGGDIQLLIAVDGNIQVRAVRVIAHQETPGLGDKMMPSNSDWLQGFIHRSLSNPLPSRWTVKKYGGEFDQWTGATITPLAITKTMKVILKYSQAHQHALFGKSNEHAITPD